MNDWSENNIMIQMPNSSPGITSTFRKHAVTAVAATCLLVASSMNSVAGAAVAAEENGKHVFILSGQSNMARLDPAETFSPAVARQFGNGNCIVIKQAAAGKPIRCWYRDWKPGKDWKPEKPDDSIAVQEDYSRSLIKQYHDAIKGQAVKSVTLIWMQGESDALERHGAVYEQSLKGFVAQMEKDLQRPDLNVVIGRISDYGSTQNMPQWELVRAAQVHFADSAPRCGWVDTDDLNDGIILNGKLIINDLHYSADGYKTLGKRFAEKAVTLIHKREKR